MELASTLPFMPFQKALRSGQQEVVDSALRPGVTELNAKLPTGYGKTFTACCVYSSLQQSRNINRMLYIVPTTAQLNQFVKDGASDLVDAGVSGPLSIIDITYVGVRAIKHHRENKAQIFATTIQSLVAGSTWDIVSELMTNGRWMIVIDEYHHYGIEKSWGIKALKLNYAFRLSMSATPYRPDDDGAFGPPDVDVSYIRAVKEKAVKPLRLHSYVYRIDLIESNGGIVSYTTEQMAAEAGSDSPETIDKMVLDRKMRWSPKYVSPLVDRPIVRMQRERIRTGYPLQVLVGTMSCSHAELVCRQIRAMFPELRIDWVGTGSNGRSEKDNASILAQFCPPKRDGRRWAEDIALDVLVHVGMAGEGLDSIFVSEVVHLNRASINNSNNQENGRAARYLDDVTGYINVDSSSPYAPYIGESLMGLMDDPNTKPEDPDEAERDPDFDPDLWPDIPDEPTIRIFDMECIRIDEGEINRFGKEMLRAGGTSETEVADVFDNPNHPNYARWMRIAENGYREMRSRAAEQFNVMAETKQWEEAVNSLVSTLTGQIVKIVSATGMRVEKSFIGDIKKRINTQKSRSIGPIERDIVVLKKHWNWLKGLESDLRKGGMPAWLQ